MTPGDGGEASVEPSGPVAAARVAVGPGLPAATDVLTRDAI